MNPKSNTANSIDNLATRNSSDLAYTGIKKKYIDLTSLSKQSIILLNDHNVDESGSISQQPNFQHTWDGNIVHKRAAVGGVDGSRIQSSPRFAQDDQVRAQTQSNQIDDLNQGNIYNLTSQDKKGVDELSSSLLLAHLLHNREQEKEDQKEEQEEDKSANNDWKQERDILLALVQKNQKLSQNLQTKYQTDKEQMENKFEKNLQQLRGQINTLKQQNKLLRELPIATTASSTSLKNIDNKKYTQQLRSQLIGEIDRLSRVYDERDTYLQNENERLRDKIEELRKDLSNLQQKNDAVKSNIQDRVSNLNREFELERNKLCSKLREAEVEKHHLQACIKIKEQELQMNSINSSQVPVQNKNYLNSVACIRAQFEQSISQIVQNLSKSSSLVEEKQNVFNTHIENLKEEFQKEIEQLNTKIINLQSEKKAIQQNLGLQLQLKTQQLLQVTQMLQKLKDNSQQLITISKQKEEAYENDIESMSSKVDQLKQKLQSDRKVFQSQTKTLVSSLQKYQKLLEDAELKLSRGWAKEEEIVIQVEKENNALLDSINNKNK